MALTEKQIYDLNHMNRAAQEAGLGDLLSGSSGKSREATSVPKATQTSYGTVKQARAVSVSAGEAVSSEEFNALIKSLKDAGIMA